MNARPSATPVAANWQISAQAPQPMHSVLVHLADVARRGQHRRAVAVGLHRAAAARAAVADGVEPAEHRVLEEGVVHVAALVLGLRISTASSDVIRRDAVGVVVADEAGKRFADDQADVQRQARICRAPARQGQSSATMWSGLLQHDVARRRVRDDLLQVTARLDVSFRPGHEPGGRVQRDDLAVVGIGKSDSPFGTVGHHDDSRRSPLGPAADETVHPTDHRLGALCQRMLAGADADVKINPASIDITVQPIEERVAGEPASLTDEPRASRAEARWGGSCAGSLCGTRIAMLALHAAF